MDAYSYLTFIKPGETVIEPGYADYNNAIALFPLQGISRSVETKG